MLNLKLITRSEYKLLLDQRDSALKLFTLERERADRLIDQVISMSGNEPVGDEYRKEKKIAEAEVDARVKEMQEIFDDTSAAVIGGRAIDREDDSASEDIVGEIAAAVAAQTSARTSAQRSPKVERPR